MDSTLSKVAAHEKTPLGERKTMSKFLFCCHGKMPWQKVTSGRKDLFYLTVPGDSPSLRESHRVRDSQEQRGHGCMGSLLLHSAGTARTHLGNNAAHSGQGLPTLVNLLRKCPTDVSTDQVSGDNPSLRHSSQGFQVVSSWQLKLTITDPKWNKIHEMHVSYRDPMSRKY